MKIFYPDAIPDQHGRLAIVTGATSGLGRECARALSGAGATVVLAVRDPAKGARVAAELKQENPDAMLEVAQLDVTDPASIQAFAKPFREGSRAVDVLLHNAGVMASTFRTLEGGCELQAATNLVGPVQLTAELWPVLVKSWGARVVVVTSDEYEKASLSTGSPAELRAPAAGVSSFQWYGQTKLAALLFARELDRRAVAMGTPVRAMAAHPGLAATNLASNVGSLWLRLGVRLMMSLVGQSARGGSRPLVCAATSTAIGGGELAAPKGLGGLRGAPHRAVLKSQALDEAMASRVFVASCELAGLDSRGPFGRMLAAA